RPYPSRTKEGNRWAEVGQRIEAGHELGLDAQHPPGLAIEKVGSRFGSLQQLPVIDLPLDASPDDPSGALLSGFLRHGPAYSNPLPFAPNCGVMRRDQVEEIVVAVAAVVLPVVLTGILLQTHSPQREYVFIYMAVVAVIAVARGLWPALLAAAVSFLLVDYYFVPPVYTLTIADEQDLVNLAIFFGTAGIVGYMAGRRRQAQIRAEALAGELRNANAELVRLNRDQAAAAQAAVRLARTEQQVQLLQQAEQDLRDLLATISHELRTPIGTILTDSTNMLRTQDMNTSVRYRIEGIATEARRLNRLLADMLSLGRIESGALHLTLEPVQVGDAVAAAAERLKRAAPERTVEWDPRQAGVSVLADWDSLGQIFDNLLDNANRFAPAGT